MTEKTTVSDIDAPVSISIGLVVPLTGEYAAAVWFINGARF